ncbi:MAG: hypothetical protein HQL38_16050 [Alphaproteobacteria bacterium]|nr:hypothetical protein [Alphaproteobacteria bacterium]
MLEDHRKTLLRSVRYRLDDARRMLAMVDLDAESSDIIKALIDLADLAVTDAIAVRSSITPCG